MLKKVLKPFKRRATFISIMQYMIMAMLLVLLYVVVLMGVSFIIPFIRMREYIIYGSMVMLAAALIIALIKRPSWKSVARLVDRHGLSERAQTALELEDREDIYATMQRNDTISYIEGTSPKIIKFSVPKRQVYIGLGLSIVIITLSIIPNPQRNIVKIRRDMEKSIEEMANELEEKAEEELKKADGLSEEEKEKLKEIMDLLSEELKKSQDFKEAAAKISKAQDELDRTMSEMNKERMDALASALQKQSVAAALGQAIKDGDIDSMAEEIDKLKDQLKENDMEREIMEALSKAFKEVANELPNGELGDNLMALSDALSSNSGGDINTMLENLDELKDILASNMDGSSLDDLGDINYLMQQMKNGILDTRGALSQVSGQGQAGGGQSQGEDPGSQGADPGQGQGQGTGQGQGSGQGQGQGQGGNGQGTGQGQGSGIGKGHSDVVGDPDRIGDGNGRAEHIKGSPTDSGRVDTIEIEGGIGGVTGPVPYNKVIGTYRRQAMEAIDRNVLPSGMEDIVREYFNGLEE